MSTEYWRWPQFGKGGPIQKVFFQRKPNKHKGRHQKDLGIRRRADCRFQRDTSNMPFKIIIFSYAFPRRISRTNVTYICDRTAIAPPQIAISEYESGRSGGGLGRKEQEFTAPVAEVSRSGGRSLQLTWDGVVGTQSVMNGYGRRCRYQQLASATSPPTLRLNGPCRT